MMARPPKNPDAPYWRQVNACKRSVIQFALDETESVSGAADALGISKTLLVRKMRELGMTEEKKTNDTPRRRQMTADELEKKLDEWHATSDKQSLQTFLELHDEGYDELLETPALAALLAQAEVEAGYMEASEIAAEEELQKRREAAAKKRRRRQAPSDGEADVIPIGSGPSYEEP